MKKYISTMFAFSLFIITVTAAYASFFKISGKAVTEHVAVTIDTSVTEQATASGTIRLKNNQTKDTILAKVDWALAESRIATIAAEGHYVGMRSSRRPNVNVLVTVIDGQASNTSDKVSALVYNGSSWNVWAHYEEVVKGDISIR